MNNIFHIWNSTATSRAIQIGHLPRKNRSFQGVSETNLANSWPKGFPSKSRSKSVPLWKSLGMAKLPFVHHSTNIFADQSHHQWWTEPPIVMWYSWVSLGVSYLPFREGFPWYGGFRSHTGFLIWIILHHVHSTSDPSEKFDTGSWSTFPPG